MSSKNLDLGVDLGSTRGLGWEFHCFPHLINTTLLQAHFLYSLSNSSHYNTLCNTSTAKKKLSHG